MPICMDSESKYLVFILIVSPRCNTQIHVIVCILKVDGIFTSQKYIILRKDLFQQKRPLIISKAFCLVVL